MITKILISERDVGYLKKRWLEKQFQKAKAYILAGLYENASLKIREPKSDNVWYFRINKQYRAICDREWDTLYIIAIDDHS